MTDWATGEGEREAEGGRGVVVRSPGVTLQGDDKCLAGIPIDARGRAGAGAISSILPMAILYSIWMGQPGIDFESLYLHIGDSWLNRECWASLGYLFGKTCCQIWQIV